MAGDHIKDRLKRKRPSLRVKRFPAEVGLAQGSDQFEVPTTVGAKQFKGRGQVVAGVMVRPGALVEGLEQGGLAGRRSKRLAQTKTEGKFAISKVCQDLTWAPLARADRAVALLRAQSLYCLMK